MKGRLGLEEFYRILGEMKEDYVHGASWYYEQASRAVLELGALDEGRLEELLEVRPGMASVVNVIRAYKRGVEAGLSIQEIHNRLIEYRKMAVEGLRAAKLEITSAMTISSSSAVKEVLEATRPLKLYILESRPGEEYRDLYGSLKGIPEVRVIPDSAMAYFLRYVDAVIVGADGIYSSGHLVNKVGTLPLACVGKELGKRVMAAAESFKFIDGFPPPSYAFVSYGSIRVPLLEPVPIDLFNAVITEMGIIEPVSPDSIRATSDAFMKAIIKGP